MAISADESKWQLVTVNMGEQFGRDMDWCKSHKEQIARSCAGIAVVTASSRLLALYKPVTALSTKKVYGCPGNVFSREAEAQEWLKVLLQKKIGSLCSCLNKEAAAGIAAVFFAFCTGKY
jgi:hypothetical protein